MLSDLRTCRNDKIDDCKLKTVCFQNGLIGAFQIFAEPIFPVGETPTGRGSYRRVSPPACENLKCARLVH